MRRLRRLLSIYFIVSIVLFGSSLVVSSIFAIQEMGLRKYFLIQDYKSFYTAGLMLQKGVRDDFYNPATQLLWQQSFTSPTEATELNPFRNPPFVALFFLLFSFLPFIQASMLLLVANFALVGMICIVVLKELGIEDRKMQVILSLAIISYLPVWHTLMLGQTSLVLVLCLLFAWEALKKRKDMHLGLWLSLLVIKPQYVIVPVFFLIAKRRTIALQWFGIGIVFFTVLSWVLIGTEGMMQYARFMLETSMQKDAFSINYSHMETLRALLQNITENDTQARALYGISSFGICILGYILFTKSYASAKPSTLDLQWSLMVLTMLLTTPYANLQDISMMLLPLIFLLQRVLKKTTSEKEKIVFLSMIIGGFYVYLIAITFLPHVHFPIGVFFTISMYAIHVYFLYRYKQVNIQT